MSKPSSISLSNIEMGYSTAINKPFSVDLFPDDFVGIIGSNGAGKSTLIKSISKQISTLSGKIKINEKDIESYTPDKFSKVVSIVLSTPPLMDNISVYDLVALGRIPYSSWMGGLSTLDHEVVNNALSYFGIEGLKNRSVYDLSDGERQKAFIARALAQQTNIILLDEPLAFLDAPYKIEILHKLRELSKKQAKTIIISIHDVELALRYFDRLIAIEKGGSIYTESTETIVDKGILEKCFIHEMVKFDSKSKRFNYRPD